MRPSLVILAVVVLYAVATAVPYRWTHELGPGCFWRAGPLSILGRASPSPRDEAERAACLRKRGLKSDSPEIYVLLRQWPDESPLPPQAHPADLQSRAGR